MCNSIDVICIMLLYMYSSTDVFLYTLLSDGTPTERGSIALSYIPWCTQFDGSHRLWVCLPDQDNAVQCFDLAGNTVSWLDVVTRHK